MRKYLPLVLLLLLALAFEGCKKKENDLVSNIIGTYVGMEHDTIHRYNSITSSVQIDSYITFVNIAKTHTGSFSVSSPRSIFYYPSGSIYYAGDTYEFGPTKMSFSQANHSISINYHLENHYSITEIFSSSFTGIK